MSKLCRKDRIENIDYKDVIQAFLEKNEFVAFIPEQQKDTNRFNWHSVAEELNVGHKTLKLWTTIDLCGAHNKPIVGFKDREIGRAYDSDYECDYECGSEEECYGNCCYREESKLCKMRTVVIFNKEGADIIKNMNVEQIKDYLVTKDVIQIINRKYMV